jgi:hypothetical protein
MYPLPTLADNGNGSASFDANDYQGAVASMKLPNADKAFKLSVLLQGFTDALKTFEKRKNGEELTPLEARKATVLSSQIAIAAGTPVKLDIRYVQKSGPASGIIANDTSSIISNILGKYAFVATYENSTLFSKDNEDLKERIRALDESRAR